MKSSNTIVTVIIIAAVLIAAYGVGLLIHQARVGNRGGKPTDANSTKAAERAAESAPAPGPGQKKDTPEMRAKVKERRAEMLEKMESASEEEKAKFKEQVRERVSGPRATKPPLDPNAKRNSEKTGVEPNAAGQG